MRAGVAIAREDIAAGRDPDKPATRRETMRAIYRSTQDAAKVVGLIVLWAVALQDLGVEQLGIEEFAAWSAESRATVYRRQHEFRRLWPEYDTPNELARLVVASAVARHERPSAGVRVAVPAVA